MAQRKNPLWIRLEYALAVVLLELLRWLPLPIANPLSRTLVRTLDLCVPKLRRVGLQNLSFAFPSMNSAHKHDLIDGVFASIARLLVSLARFPSFDQASVRQWIGYEGLENYHLAKQAGRGVLVATAHLGNWEFSAFSHALMTEPMSVMVRPLDNPLIDNMVERRRQSSGNHLIQKKDAARAVIRALRNNEAVGILIDQNTAASEGVFVNFFGKAACAGTAFAKFAHHSGAVVIPGFALWNSDTNRYVLRFYPEVEMTGDAAADTQRIHAIFEQIIREFPDQWMWIHRRWKTRPAGEPALY